MTTSSTASRITCAAFLALTVASFYGCSDIAPIRGAKFGTLSGQYSTAEYRLISIRKRAKVGTDQDIVCSEPSPDIAKAFSTAISANVKAGTTTVGMSVAQSQAIAELGKRYATVELLRDIRFRDCEDYSNGIIDKVEYGYRLSRFSGLVVTLFGMEMTSGDNPATQILVQSPPPNAGASGDGPAPDDPKTNPDKKNKPKATDTPAADGGAGDAPATPPDTGANDKLKAAATSAMKTLDDSVTAATAATAKVTTSPADADKAAVGALSTAIDAVKKSAGDLDKAWLLLSKATTKPDAASTTLLKTAATDMKDAQSKITALDAACKSASDDVVTACKLADEAGKNLTTGSKALKDYSDALSKAAPKTPQTTPPVTPPPAALTYRPISDTQAKMIAQMQQVYLKYDDTDIEKIPCADAESELTIRPKFEKLTAFQVFCLFKDNVPLDLETDTIGKLGKSSASSAISGPTGGGAVDSKDQAASLIVKPLNTEASREAMPALLGFTGNTQRDAGIAAEKNGYAQLELQHYPEAALAFATADANYPNIGNAYELQTLLKPLGASPTAKQECDALHAIQTRYTWHLPTSTAVAINSREAALSCP